MELQYYISAYIAIAKPAPGKNLGGGGISAIAMIYIFAVCEYHSHIPSLTHFAQHVLFP
jgi:hypothetical protein